jgi:hypothetical protein
VPGQRDEADLVALAAQADLAGAGGDGLGRGRMQSSGEMRESARQGSRAD